MDMQPLDPKVPSFTGEGGHTEFKQWSKFAKAFALSMKTDERGEAGNRLLLNLRGEAARLADEFEPQDLVDDDDTFDDAGDTLVTIVKDSGKGKGWRRLIRLFGVAFPEGKLRELPRVYRDFFLKCKCTPGNDGAMNRYVNELKR